MRSIFAGTALTTVMLVALPFWGSPPVALEGIFVGSETAATSAANDAARDDESMATLIAAAVPRTARESSDESSDTPESTGEDSDGSTEPGSASGGSTDTAPPASEGDTAGRSTPTPSAPAPAPSPSTPAAPPAPPAPAAPACPAAISGSTPGAPGRTSTLGVAGTSSSDLQSFAERYNAIRVANCLPPVPFANIRFDSCMEDRLFWMAEDPSTDPMSAWGHIGSQRSDGLPSVGCDGNLAGGSDNTGATVAQKWWDSSGHRTSLYKTTFAGSTANVCILFAMTHGGVPNEPFSFTRAAARWTSC